MPTVEMEMDYLSLALRRHPLASLRQLNIVEQGNYVILTGTLGSFYHKQLAQEALIPLLAGRVLLNRVEVIPPS
jgi:hypothetical protein